MITPSLAQLSPADITPARVRLSRAALRTREDFRGSAYHLAPHSPEIVHFGPGRIFKGLFAPLVERASRSRFEAHGTTIGISAVFRSPNSTGYRELSDQDGLYLLHIAAGAHEPAVSTTNDPHREVVSLTSASSVRHDPGAVRSTSIVGCVRNVVHHEDLELLRRTFTDQRLKIVSTSITAAAYDERSHGDIDRDIRTLESLGGRVLETPALRAIRLRTTFGIVLLGLMQRHEHSATTDGQGHPVTLLALENLESNGKRLKDRLIAMARELDRLRAAPDGFTKALIDDVRSPNLVVDRLVPHPPSQVSFETRSGAYACSAGVITEPEGRMVVAGDPDDPDPNLAILGDTIRTVTDVDAHSRAKAGLLNTVQALSGGIWLQTRSTATTVAEFLAEPGVENYVKGLLCEISHGLDSSDECDIDAYWPGTLLRLRNAELGDTMPRLASQLPRKLRQYVAPAVCRALADGHATEHLIDALHATLSTVDADPRTRAELLEHLSGSNPELLRKLTSRLAAAEQKVLAVGAETVFAPIVSIGQPAVAAFERAGLCLGAFVRNPEHLPIRLNDGVMVLFDNDGTLVNSEAIALEAAHGLVSDILARHDTDNPLTVPEFSDRFAGKNFRIILSELNQDLLGGQLDESQILLYSDEEDDRCIDALAGTVTATPHTLPTLRWVPRGHKAVVTSASRRRCDASLGTLEIEDQFDRQIFSAVDTLPHPRPKPDPAIYEHAIAELRLRCGQSQHKSIVVLEDSGSGVTSARRAGAHYVIGFVGADHLPTVHARAIQAEKLRMAGATDIIDDMALLPLILAERGFAQRAEVPGVAA